MCTHVLIRTITVSIASVKAEIRHAQEEFIPTLTCIVLEENPAQSHHADVMINVEERDLALLFAQHEEHRFNILGQSEKQKVPRDPIGLLLVSRDFANNALQAVAQRVSVSVGFDDEPEAKRHLKNVVDPRGVREVERLAVLHKPRSEFQHEQQVNR